MDPNTPPEPGPEAAAEPGVGFWVLTGSWRSRSLLRLVFLRSSRYIGRAWGLWMTRGTYVHMLELGLPGFKAVSGG